MSSDLSYHQKDNQKHETDNEQDSETISQISSNLIDMTLVSEALEVNVGVRIYLLNIYMYISMHCNA